MVVRCLTSSRTCPGDGMTPRHLRGAFAADVADRSVFMDDGLISSQEKYLTRAARLKHETATWSATEHPISLPAANMTRPLSAFRRDSYRRTSTLSAGREIATAAFAGGAFGTASMVISLGPR